MKSIKETYYRPTPKKMRKIGDSILSLGTTISGITVFTLPAWVTIISLLLTWAGKTITNLYSE